MDTSKLNEWLQVITSVGVLIGLFAVAYELRQNSVYALVEHTRENHRNWMQIGYLEIESDIYDSLVRSIEEPEELSQRDMFKLSAWLMMNMSIGVYGETAHELGVATSAALFSDGAARYFFATDFARRWFEGNKGWLGARQVETISRVIESTPIATSREEVFGTLLNTDME